MDATFYDYIPPALSFDSRMERLSLNEVSHLFAIEDLPYVYRIKYIRTIVPWVLLAFGMVGNGFIIAVFLRKRSGKHEGRMNSNAFCFCALAIADSLALIFMLTRSLMLTEFIKNFSLTCKLFKFTYYTSLQISSWCLVLLTIDRLIAVVFVFKYQTWAKLSWTRKILVGIVISVILLNSHILIFVNSQLTEEDFATTSTRRTPYLWRITTTARPFLPNYICTASNYIFYNRYFYSNWDIYHAVIYGALPFVIILASTVFILVRLFRYRNHRMIKTSSPTGVTDETEKFRSYQVTIMLLSVATLFLLFTGPISIYMTFIYNNLHSMRDSQKSFIRTLLTHLAYCNNAVNFYVYVCLSSEFRREWLKLVYCCRLLNPKNVTTTCTTTTTLGSTDNLDSAKRPLPPLPTSSRSKPKTPPLPKPRKLKPVKLDDNDTMACVQSDQPLLEQQEASTTQASMNNVRKSKLFDDRTTFINADSTFV